MSSVTVYSDAYLPLRPPTGQEPLLLTELNNSATFPHPTTYFNPPSTRCVDRLLLFVHSADYGTRSTNHGLYSLPQEQAPFQLPQQM